MNKIVQYTSKLWYSIIEKSRLRVIYMKGKYSALDIAKYVINDFNLSKKDITQLKLQKLLYFIEAYYMAEYDKDSLYTEDFYAWTYGPVIKEVYDKYKIFMSDPIVLDDNNISIELNEELINCINMVYDSFGELSSFNLIMITHMKGSPWYETKNQGKISKIKTREWFKKLFLNEE